MRKTEPFSFLRRDTSSMRFATRAGLLALTWFLLNGGDGKSWLVGIPTVLAAAWISCELSSKAKWRISIKGVLLFLAYFLRESLRAGWSVSRLALSPKPDLKPAVIHFKSRLPFPTPRLLFCAAVSVLAGTTVLGIGPGIIEIHVLAYGPGTEKELNKLERRVAAVFGFEGKDSLEVRL